MLGLPSAPLRVALMCLLAAPALAACGGDDDGDDTPVVDARPVDASPPDAAVDPCMALCTCAADFCGGELTACLATCASLDDSVVQCRLLHCGYAQTNPSFHCPHVDGDPDAPGVPAECIQE